MRAETLKTLVIKWLLEENLAFNPKKDVIAAEVLFSANKRKADLLIISDETHSLEIKSDFDNTDKLRGQLKDYLKTFDKVSVVTTPKHIKQMKKLLAPNAGLILLNGKQLKIVKKAKKNTKLNKFSLLMFLPKNRLKILLKQKGASILSTDQMRERVAHQLTLNEIRKYVNAFLKQRYSKLFTLLIKDTDGKIIWDELRGLSGEVNKLRF